MLHGKDGEFETDHAADLAGPKPAGIDHMFCLHRPVLGNHVPGPVCFLRKFDNPVAQLDLRAQRSCRLGVGVRCAGGVKVSFDRIPHGADEVAFVHQGIHRLGFGRRDQFGFHAHAAALGVGEAEEVHTFGRIRHHGAAGQMQSTGLTGDLLQLLVERDGVGLQFGDVGVGVERMEAAGRMP